MDVLHEQLPVLIYQREGEHITEVRLEGETVWLTQRQMAELFDKDVRTVNEHIGNVFTEGELEAEATIRNFRIVRQEGRRQVSRDVEHYSLDVIISVGYRVKSVQGTRFRIWANRILKDHLIQGYSLNQRRLEAQQARIGRLKGRVCHPTIFFLFQSELSLRTNSISSARVTPLLFRERGWGRGKFPFAWIR